MYVLPTAILAFALGASEPISAAPPTIDQVRQSIERSLAFLEKSGTGWWKSNKCASCHHVPISIWSMSEAKKRGFAIDDKALDQLRDGAVASYANHPKLRPVGQDGEEKGLNLSMNTIYLTQAASSFTALDDKTAAALKKFTTHLLANQDVDGAWKSTAHLPPVGDVTEVRTMQVLLTLAMAHERGLVEKAPFTSARDKALKWLAAHKFLDQNQSLNLRLLVAKRFGQPSEVAALVKELCSQQEPDGGWAQTRALSKEAIKDYDGKKTKGVDNSKRPSDAMATGQSLYALTAAGVDRQQSAVQRAQAFLIRTQTTDGSWRVPIRSQKNSGTALSHYGTGWATMGLMVTLPPASVP